MPRGRPRKENAVLQRFTSLASGFAAQIEREVRAQIARAVQSEIAEMSRRLFQGGKTSGAVKVERTATGRPRRKLVMECPVAGCKNQSRGPRFSFFCQEHGESLSAADKKAALEARKARLSGAKTSGKGRRGRKRKSA